MTYREYLKSYDWQVQRQRALKAAGYRCQVCNSPDSLQAHHRTYEHLYDEQPGDLTILCDACHELFGRRTADRPYKFLERLGWIIQDVQR